MVKLEVALFHSKAINSPPSVVTTMRLAAPAPEPLIAVTPQAAYPEMSVVGSPSGAWAITCRLAVLAG